jgi:hypothetical protein
MVIAEEPALKPFKSKVVSWTVWKFPPSKKYNYHRKFEDNPGRSALIIAYPQELEVLRKRLSGMEDLRQAMKEARGYMKRETPVFITVPRESRGYFFLLAAHDAEGMKALAEKFFSLKSIPSGVVPLD